MTNKKIKGHRHESFLCHEGYFVMYDYKNEKVSQERLGLKLMLVRNSKLSFLNFSAPTTLRWTWSGV